MKILFAIQGTGNGHISRAREIVPLLQQHGHVDLLVSGTQADVSLDQPLSYRFHGFSFVFGKKGSVNHWKTYRSMSLLRLKKDISSLPLNNYDLIINDFEPVTAWACRMSGKPSVSLSHQASFLSHNTPRPSSNFNWAEWIFKYYAPTTDHVGFHFKAYDHFIHTPVIRKEIRNQEITDNGHVTVYLPSFDDRLLVPFLKQLPEIKWEIFSKHTLKSYRDGNVFVNPVSHQAYNQSLASSHGLLTGGGFEGPAEALFMGKRVLVIPMKNQYEQQCNAEALRQMGVPIIYNLDSLFVPALRRWLSQPFMVQVDFPDHTSKIIGNIVNTYSSRSSFLSSGLLS
ncbi:glycosyltransferase family protein [Daejeonella oryzae]|uniref:glycosyltransferase family protein n=1 Tax=Daejeonella oryzae TaxID=1122943 RepID=UPI00041AC155|nr:glycosyltransferase family protein [Daejeonella oryzae]